MTYAFSENYILPLSHDEVVHGKCSLINKMPGVYEQKFANLRAFLAYQIAHPGKKLLFMGSEFAQFIEWDYQKELDWLLLEYEYHQKFHCFMKDINHLYLKKSPLWQIDDSWDGFTWLVNDDNTQNIFMFLRRDKKSKEILCVFNFSPILRKNYRLGMPRYCRAVPIFSTDDLSYGGEGTKLSSSTAKPVASHGYPYSLSLTVAPMSAAFYEIKPIQQKEMK